MRTFQKRGAFIAAFPVDKMIDDNKKKFTTPLVTYSAIFIAPLPIGV
jgi:hypothetical protein